VLGVFGWGGWVLALGIGGVAAYNAARPVEDPWKSA